MPTARKLVSVTATTVVLPRPKPPGEGERNGADSSVAHSAVSHSAVSHSAVTHSAVTHSAVAHSSAAPHSSSAAARSNILGAAAPVEPAADTNADVDVEEKSGVVSLPAILPGKPEAGLSTRFGVMILAFSECVSRRDVVDCDVVNSYFVGDGLGPARQTRAHRV